jgi:FixJ family two-component response regulator
MPSEARTIVVVEDDVSMSQAIERILRAGGYAAVTFATAELALAADAMTRVDCLILDIHLPGISGLDMYERLVESGRRPVVIFITAHDDPTFRERAERMGAKSYLRKPFSGRALLDAVNLALRLP